MFLDRINLYVQNHVKGYLNVITMHCKQNFFIFTFTFIVIDIQCGNLTTPSNGGMSCSSGRVGVGYEGDTCNFTCKAGYELTGNDTRTCQSDGSWSDTETMCRRGVFVYICNYYNNHLILPVRCPILDGTTYICSLGDDGVPSYEDTCNITCSTGYELTGGDTRTCQSNGSWSTTEAMCSRGIL